jgi:hypothetical protein
VGSDQGYANNFITLNIKRHRNSFHDSVCFGEDFDDPLIVLYVLEGQHPTLVAQFLVDQPDLSVSIPE